MPIIRLTPSTYTRSSTNRVTVTNDTNMYYNTDHTSAYCSIRGRNSSSNTYYCFIHGFNFNDVPSNAVVTGFRVLIRCYRNSYQSTSSSYYMRLASRASNSYVISGTTTSTAISETTSVIEIPTGNLDWDDIAGYGSGFSIDIPLRSTASQYPYVYVYGAEIEVTYTVPNPRTITSTLSGNGTISPSGSGTYYDGDEYELTITPTNISDTVTVTNNNVDVTSELVEHYSGGTSTSYSTASESDVTTGFARSGGAFYQSSSTSSDSWLRYAIGHTAESPYSTSNTSNTYCKDGTNDSTTQGWMNYPFDFSSLPNDAEVTAVEIKCYGAAESTSETARHADVSLWCGNEQKGTTQAFSSTSNTTMTISDPGEWTREDLQDAWVRFGVGYYGGRILGITWKVTYTYGGTLHHYTYTYNVNGNATIAVTIGSVSPVSVTGVTVSPTTASIEVGNTQQLTATVSPNNATDKSVTWSSNDTSVATVSSTGLVTGISAGNATITVTTTDGGYTATCTITVAAAVTYTYKPASTMVVGKKYLIANGNTGSVYLLTNESGGSRQLVGMSVTVSNGKISLTSTQKAKAEFECVQYTAGNDVTITVQSDNKYLYTDNSTGLRMESTSSLNRFWHYNSDGNKFWQFKSTTTDGWTDTSSEYKYYLEMTGNNFTDNHLTSPSVSDTTIPAMYIFVEDDGSAESIIYIKNNNTWTQYSKIYKKINGSWVEQDVSTWSTLFNTNINYRKMT